MKIRVSVASYVLMLCVCIGCLSLLLTDRDAKREAKGIHSVLGPMQGLEGPFRFQLEIICL